MSWLFESGSQSIAASVLAISPSNEYSGLISFRMDWLDLLAVQETLKSLLRHHSSKASVLRCSVFLVVHGSPPELVLCQTRGRWWEGGWGILLLAHSGLPHPSHPSLPTPKHTHTPLSSPFPASGVGCTSNHRGLPAAHPRRASRDTTTQCHVVS